MTISSTKLGICLIDKKIDELKHKRLSKEEIESKGLELLVENKIYTYATERGSDSIYIFSKDQEDNYSYRGKTTFDKYEASKFYQEF